MIPADFPRLGEVQTLVLRKAPKHALFCNAVGELAHNARLSAMFRDVEDLLAVVPAPDWPEFRADLAARFNEGRRPEQSRRSGLRRYQPAWDKLNEARASRRLSQDGFEAVRFVRALPGTKTPDLVGFLGDEPVFCEVKTVNISDREATRRAEGGVGTTETAANEALLAKSLDVAIRALAQVRGYECDCRAIVYLFLNPDDSLGEPIATIAAQVKTHLDRAPELAGATIHIDHHPPFHFAV